MKHALVSLLLFALLPTLSMAEEPLAQPTGPVILEVSGKITNTNRGDRAVFDRRMLEALPQRTTVTKTPWTDSSIRFRGPLGRALLERVGARGDTLEVTALNDYTSTIPAEDFHKYPVILALRKNGDYMRIREHGPIFIVYPFDEYPDLMNEVIFLRSVWQVKAIRVK